MSNIRVYTYDPSTIMTPNMGPTINPVPLAQEPLPYVVGPGPLAGSLAVLSIAEQGEELGGGLVGHDYILPPDFTPSYFGLNVRYQVSGAMLPNLARQECDLKITLTSGASGALANQANGSNQLKPIADSSLWDWQVDPTGSGWVSSGYTTAVIPDVPNEMQARWATTSTQWSITDLWDGKSAAFAVPSQFQNLPLISTTWTAGMLLQLQNEVQNTPAALLVTYLVIQVIASDAPVRMGWF